MNVMNAFFFVNIFPYSSTKVGENRVRMSVGD